jgi:hypothetical protein
MSQVSESEKKKEDWMNSKWRPMMGWMYMAVCAMDFMVFPVLWSVLQSLSHGQINSQWQPLTLQGAGLFHIAMGAVLGIAAYGRTKEKMAGAENGGLGGFGPGVGTTYVPPGQGQVNISNQPGMMGGMNSGMGGFGQPSGFGGNSGFNNQNSFNSPGSFNSQPSSFNTQPSSFNNSFAAAPAPIGMSSSGKKMPPPADEPLL